MTIDTGLGVALGFLLTIFGHEIVQHRVAVALGDKTPRLMGRLSLSPQAHIDPLGTLIIPSVFVLAGLFNAPFHPMFGWGKRHSINARSLRSPKRDAIIVALSGPATALAIGFVAGRAATVLGGPFLTELLTTAAQVAVAIAVLEILPLPGRDGARILQQFVSPGAAMKIEDLAQYEVLFLLVIYIFDPLRRIVLNMVAVVYEPLIGL